MQGLRDKAFAGPKACGTGLVNRPPPARCSVVRRSCESQHQSHSALKHAASSAAAAMVMLPTFAAQAGPLISPAAESDPGALTFAVGGGVAIAGLGALLVATDPQKRRAEQIQQTGGNESDAVKKYFNTEGFQRWNKIYGETDDVNKVQLDIRKGHAMTVEKVLKWVDEEGGIKDVTVCDAGCGTGSLAIPLALRGAAVSASDISSAMASEAARRFEAAVASGKAAPSTAPKFEALDLESVKGKYNTVTCLDVMIHYPQDRVDNMISHLASLAEKRLIISFAPKTLAYSVLKRIGELFPGPSKATRAYLHAEDDVEAALRKCGFKVVKKEMTATNFYFSRLFEAVRV